MSKFVVWFEDLGKESVGVAGGKGANLGELLRFGMPVPSGFVLSTEAYDAFLKRTGADREIRRFVNESGAEAARSEQYEEMSTGMRRIVETKEIPMDMRATVVSEYRLLCQKSGVDDLPVAVRSSGVAEDMATASFAGQHESYINVRGESDLLEKIVKCWGSLFTPQAIAYRIKRAMSVEGASIGVVVQRMVNTRSAGICFTVHPTTNDPSRIYVECNWGLGESVVQGTCDPDRFVINKDTLKTEEKTIGRKVSQIIARGTGTGEEGVSPDKQQILCLSDEEVEKLAELSRAVELHYGVPQDIEWAVDAHLSFPENIFLVQTRAITTAVKKEEDLTRYIIDMMLTRVFGR